MKELLQRQAMERQLQQKQPPQPQHQQQGTLQQQASPQASLQPQPNQQLPQPHVTASQPVSQQPLQSRAIEPTAVSQSSTAPVQQQPRASTTAPSSQPSVTMTSLPSQPSAVMTSLPSHPSAMISLPSQLNQVLSRDQLAQLTAEQRVVYFRQLQLLKAKQMELQKQQKQMASSASASADLQSRPPLSKVNASVTSVGQAMTLQAVLEKQQQLVKEQQGPLGRVPPQTVSNKFLAPTHVQMAPPGGLVARGGASNTQQTSAVGRTSFANLKVVPGGLAGRSSSPSNVVGQPHARGRPKGAREKGKDALDAQE